MVGKYIPTVSAIYIWTHILHSANNRGLDTDHTFQKMGKEVKKRMVEWDYLFLSYTGEEDWVYLQEIFKRYGEEGWELVTYMNDMHVGAKVRLFIFKRKK